MNAKLTLSLHGWTTGRLRAWGVAWRVGMGTGAPLLTSTGVECLALDPPGHGEDGQPLGDLYSDATRVRATLDQLKGDVVLVGHSYGGAVITEAGLHPPVEHLVYIVAFALDAGESCVSAATAEIGASQISHDGRPNLGIGFAMSPWRHDHLGPCERSSKSPRRLRRRDRPLGVGAPRSSTARHPAGSAVGGRVAYQTIHLHIRGSLKECDELQEALVLIITMR